MDDCTSGWRGGCSAGRGARPLARVAGVSIDSRTLRPGELFIAIHGPRHDGHDHVPAAVERGALAAVVADWQLSRYPGWVGDRCIPVADTFEALAKLARAVREAWGGKIAGVTGSVGKTTTKEILAALLGAKLRVLKSEGNFNNEYGLPLTLFGLEETHQAAVLEMGMSRPGELKRLAAIARPDVGVVTRVSPAHLEFFISIDEIALAKRELIEGLNGSESVAVLNADDPRVAAFAPYAPGKVLTYGIDSPADFRAEQIEDRGAWGSAFVLVSNQKPVRLEVALAGRHVISNALAALAAASVWGIGASEAQSVLRSLKAPFMRGELMQLANGAALINDSYNSSPAALHAMIAVLAATTGYRRRILAAGEMRELGRTSAELHREAGHFARAWLPRPAKSIGSSALQVTPRKSSKARLPPACLARTQNSSPPPKKPPKFLADFVESGDVLLVKGSRGVKMERIVDALLSRYAPQGEAPREEARH